MHVIFGKEKDQLEESDVDIETLKTQYSIVPLDRVRYSDQGEVIQSWCLLSGDNTSTMEEAPHLPRLIELHENMMQNYYRREWKFCEDAAENLKGRFGGELDSFYQHFLNRVRNYIDNEPDANWDGVINNY